MRRICRYWWKVLDILPDHYCRFTFLGVLGSLILFDLLCHQSDPSTKSDAVPGDILTPPSIAPTVEPVEIPAKPPASSLTLEEALEKMNLASYQSKFEAEQMDMDTLVRISFIVKFALRFLWL